MFFCSVQLKKCRKNTPEIEIVIGVVVAVAALVVVVTAVVVLAVAVVLDRETLSCSKKQRERYAEPAVEKSEAFFLH